MGLQSRIMTNCLCEIKVCVYVSWTAIVTRNFFGPNLALGPRLNKNSHDLVSQNEFAFKIF